MKLQGGIINDRAVNLDYGKPKGTGTGCFKCGDEGHRSYECPTTGGSPGASTRGGGAGRGARGRGGGRGRGGRGGFDDAKAKNRGSAAEFAGTKVSFDD